MKTLLAILVTLCLAGPLWSQVEPSASGGSASPDDDESMSLPSAVSGEAYPNRVASEERSNFLSLGLNFTSAYTDNVIPGNSAGAVSDESYAIMPTIAFDQTVPRQHRSITYGAGFIFYDPTSQLNMVQQNAAVNYKYRFTPRLKWTASDNFHQSTNAFNGPNPTSEVTVTGTTEPPTVAVFAPYAEQISNAGSVGMSYQYAKNGMISASGFTALLNYPNPKESAGLYDYISEGASGSMTRRLGRIQFLGLSYGYYRAVAGNVSSVTNSHAASVFYTVALKHSLTLSFTGGPQYFTATYGTSTASDWTPSGTASIGWHRPRVNFAASFSRAVWGGGGLLGTYTSTNVNGEFNWQLSRRWVLNAGSNYFLSKNATAIQYSAYPGGHTLYGTTSLRRSFGEHFRAEFGYTRLHESYNGVTSVSAAPDSDRGFVTLTYHFTRPLGR